MAETFGELVLEARLAAKLSQRALAERAGINQTTISGVERGLFRPRYDIVIGLARALQVPEGVLLTAAGFPLPVTQEAEAMSQHDIRVWKALKANEPLMIQLDRARRYESQAVYERVLARAFELTASMIDIELRRLEEEAPPRQGGHYAPASLAEAYGGEAPVGPTRRSA